MQRFWKEKAPLIEIFGNNCHELFFKREVFLYNIRPLDINCQWKLFCIYVAPNNYVLKELTFSYLKHEGGSTASYMIKLGKLEEGNLSALCWP